MSSTEEFAFIDKNFIQPFDTNFLLSVILLKGAFIMGKKEYKSLPDLSVFNFETFSNISLYEIAGQKDFVLCFIFISIISGLLFKDIVLGGLLNIQDEIYAEPYYTTPYYLTGGSSEEEGVKPFISDNYLPSTSIVRPKDRNIHIPLNKKSVYDSKDIMYDDVQYDYDEYEYDLDYPYSTSHTYHKNAYVRPPTLDKKKTERQYSSSRLAGMTPNPSFSDQFIFPDHYVISEPSMGSTRYDRRLIIKLPASQPPDIAIHALGIDSKLAGRPSTYQNILHSPTTTSFPQVINSHDFISSTKEERGKGTWEGNREGENWNSYNYY